MKLQFDLMGYRISKLACFTMRFPSGNNTSSSTKVRALQPANRIAHGKLVWRLTLQPPWPVENYCRDCIRNAIRSLRSSALGTLKLMLLSEIIKSGLLSHLSSVVSVQVMPELFNPFE